MGGLLNRQAWRRRWLGSVCRVHEPNQRIVSLTFDDGPAPATPEVLDILKHYQVPAAFFLVGRHAENDPVMVERIHGNGHEIGNHTMAHEALNSLNWEETRTTLRDCDKVLTSITGQRPRLRRPCYGWHTPAFGTANLLSGCTSVAWSRDGADWLQPPAEKMLEKITTGLNPGDIILLHDGSDFPEDPALNSRRETVRLLPLLIEEVRSKGFEFVSLNQLLAAGKRQYIYWMPHPPKPDDLPKRSRR